MNMQNTPSSQTSCPHCGYTFSRNPTRVPMAPPVSEDAPSRPTNPDWPLRRRRYRDESEMGYMIRGVKRFLLALVAGFFIFVFVFVMYAVLHPLPPPSY